MQAVIDAITHTPIWVYFLFGYLLFRGIGALKPRTVSVKKLLIIPLIFVSWGLYNLIGKIHDPLVDWGSWLGALFIGAGLGWWFTHFRKIKVDRKKKMISLPGGPATLIFVLLIFSTKYFFGYLYATDPTAKDSVAIHIANIATSGALIGIFIGRVLSYLSKFKKPT